MAATNSAFRTETRDEPIYNHLELFNMPSSSIEAPAANDYQDCREQQPTGNIGKGRRMFSDYRTERNNEHLYSNVESVNKPSLPAIESQAVNQSSQDDSRGQQPTGNSTTIGLRVLYAMIAVLALAFLAMLASLIALHWENVKSSGTNGCQDGRMEQQLNTFRQDVLLKIQNLKDEIKDSNKTIREAIKNQTLELKQKIRVSIVNQTNLGRQLHGEINNLTLEFKGLAAQINQTDEGGLVLDGMQQQLTNVERNISFLADKNLVNEMAARIIHDVSSNQTEGRRLLETKIETLKLNQINCTGCPSDWTHFNSYCYFVSKELKPWRAAKTFCEHWEGELVQITSFEENEYVFKLVKKREPSLQRVWIGLKYNQEVNKFLWSDNAVPYFKYWPNSTEPLGSSSKPCVYMFTSHKFEQRKAPGSWNDFTCESFNGFVCKKLQ